MKGTFCAGLPPAPDNHGDDMCGRFASARKRQELLAEFQIERDRVTESLQPDYNVAPTKPVYAVLTRGQRGAEAAAGKQAPAERVQPASTASGDVARELRVVRWGLVPSWAKDISIGNRLINARAETVDSKPAFRKAFARHRCLLPADGFYEWIQVEKQGVKRKQPYYIHRADGGALAFAGLYEIWRDTSYPGDHPQAWLWSAVIITTRAQDEIGRIHDRMPMVIEPARWDDWLDPGNNDVCALHTLLAPASSGRLTSYPVAMDVNSVRNNGPALIRPLPGEPLAGQPLPGQPLPGEPLSGQPLSGQPLPGEPGESGNGGGSPRGRPAVRGAAQAASADGPGSRRDRYRHHGNAPLTLF